jgi:hypothetical protein
LVHSLIGQRKDEDDYSYRGLMERLRDNPAFYKVAERPRHAMTMSALNVGLNPDNFTTSGVGMDQVKTTSFSAAQFTNKP